MVPGEPTSEKKRKTIKAMKAMMKTMKAMKEKKRKTMKAPKVKKEKETGPREPTKRKAKKGDEAAQSGPTLDPEDSQAQTPSKAGTSADIRTPGRSPSPSCELKSDGPSFDLFDV